MNHGAAMDHGGMHDPAASADAMKPIVSPVPLRMASALDANPIVADILTDRAGTISKDPAHEVVILVAHGPVPDDDNKLWLRDMGALADHMRSKTRYAALDCLTLRDDADDPGEECRDRATSAEGRTGHEGRQYGFDRAAAAFLRRH